MRNPRLCIYFARQYKSYWPQKDTILNAAKEGSEKLSKFTEDGSKKLLETGTEQAIKALGIVSKKLNDFSGNHYTASVSFTVGPLSVSFSETTLEKKSAFEPEVQCALEHSSKSTTEN